MNHRLTYLYLLSPLHTGGASQEGNVVGIARETHTDLPYLPSSSIRGRLRAATPETDRIRLWGNTIGDVADGNAENLTQGGLWVGDGALLWFPVPSLSHGVVWVTSPFLLRRWLRFVGQTQVELPSPGAFSGGNGESLYLRDAVFQTTDLHPWENWHSFVPTGSRETETIQRTFILSDRDCTVLVQSSLWRQVKVKLDDTKTVEGGFRYEEAIPPETVMYFPWGSTVAANGKGSGAVQTLEQLLSGDSAWQFGGQESLGRGLVDLWNFTEN